ITTKTENASYEAWDAKKAYKKGDRVLHEGKVYEAVQSYQGNGDPNWIYALSLWKTV
ncbi:carbohydrate-binding protein, partial [Bacillus cereus]